MNINRTELPQLEKTEIIWDEDLIGVIGEKCGGLDTFGPLAGYDTVEVSSNGEQVDFFIQNEADVPGDFVARRETVVFMPGQGFSLKKCNDDGCSLEPTDAIGTYQKKFLVDALRCGATQTDDPIRRSALLQIANIIGGGEDVYRY